MRRILRSLVLAVLLLAVGGVAAAQTPGCDIDALAVDGAVLTITPDLNKDEMRVVLTGRTAYSGHDPAFAGDDPARAFCEASVGPHLMLNEQAVCDDFNALRKDDRIKVSDGVVRFELSTTRYEADRGQVRLDMGEGQSICSKELVVDVKRAGDLEFGRISGVPEHLGRDLMRYRLTRDAAPARTQIWLSVQRDYSRPDATTTALKPPPSWSEAGYIASRFWSLGEDLFLAVAMLGLLGVAMHRQPLPASTMMEALSRPLMIVLAFSLAAGLLSAGSATASLVYQFLFNLGAEGIQTLFTGQRMSASSASLSLPFLIAVLIGSALLVGVLRLVAGRRWTKGSPASIFCAALLTACMLALAVGVFSAALELVERHGALVFEAPALVISLGCALLGVWAVRRQTNWSGLAVFSLGVLIAVTALYPASAVVRGEGGMMAATNAFFWGMMISKAVAGHLYVGALALFAFALASDDRMPPALLARWLVILLILQVAGFGISTPANALAVAGVLILSARWLFALSRLDAAPVQPIPTPAGGSFPFLVGGGAAAIFLAQYVFSTPDTSFTDLPLLDLAAVPRAFAIGAVGGLALWRGFPYLRGDSATLKAANIGLVIAMADMASNLDALRGQEALISVLTSNMGVMAALIFGALVYFDLGAVKAGGGGTWRDLFKGTTLAHAVPLVSAIAAALFSALGPILIDEMKSAFSEMVRDTAAPLPQQAPEPQTSPAPEAETAPPPESGAPAA